MTLKEKREKKRDLKNKIEERRSHVKSKRERLEDTDSKIRAAHLADEIDSLMGQLDRLVPAYKKAGRWIARRLKKINKRKNFASENFTYSEFNCREGDPVPEYMYIHLRDLCRRVLEPMRAKFGGCYVTSGHRWSWYDAKIGGVGGYHVYEKYQSQPAADLIFEKGSPAEWAAYARQLGQGGVGQYNNSGFVHVDTGPRRDWWG